MENLKQSFARLIHAADQKVARARVPLRIAESSRQGYVDAFHAVFGEDEPLPILDEVPQTGSLAPRIQRVGSPRHAALYAKSYRKLICDMPAEWQAAQLFPGE